MPRVGGQVASSPHRRAHHPRTRHDDIDGYGLRLPRTHQVPSKSREGRVQRPPGCNRSLCACALSTKGCFLKCRCHACRCETCSHASCVCCGEVNTVPVVRPTLTSRTLDDGRRTLLCPCLCRSTRRRHRSRCRALSRKSQILSTTPSTKKRRCVFRWIPVLSVSIRGGLLSS